MLARLTDRGLGVLRRAGTYLRGIKEHFTRHLAPEEVQVMTAALSRVVAAARASAEDQPQEPDQPEEPEALASAGSAANP
jgi:hypothetical protein